MAYYAATGTALSGDANLTFNPASGTTVTISDTGTDTQVHPVNMIHETSATPAIGLGVGLDYSIKPALGEVLLGRMEVQEQATVAGSETADFVFKLRNGSGDPATTNEVFRMTNAGGFSTTTSIPSGTTVTVGSGVGGGVVVGGTGTFETVNGAISAGGTADITAVGGNITADAGAVSAGTTVTAGTGLTATAGGITALGGDILASAGSVTGATGLTATAGGITATAGGITATAGGITATTGNIVATAGAIRTSKPNNIISGVNTPDTAAGSGADLIDSVGSITVLSGDNYLLGGGGSLFDFTSTDSLGFSASFLAMAAPVTVTLGGSCDGVIAGGIFSASAFSVPQGEPFSISVVGDLAVSYGGGAAGTQGVVQVYGNVTAL